MELSATSLTNESKGFDTDSIPLFLRASYNELYQNRGYDVLDVRLDNASKHIARGFFGHNLATYSSPFSAPFGGFWPMKKNLSITDYMALGNLLAGHLKQNKIESCRITLPPNCYNPAHTSMQLKGLSNSGFSVDYVDINHSLDLTSAEFDVGLHRGGRRSIKRAMSHGLQFIACETDSDCRRAYAAIKTNREQKEKPLHLSYEDIERVKSATEIHFFLITQAGKDIAGAIVYEVTSTVNQVIYWGNDVNYNSLNPIHFLAMNLFDFYKDGKTILDIGPSSYCGRIDEGLCRFKESIGCNTSLKYTLSLGEGMAERHSA